MTFPEFYVSGGPFMHAVSLAAAAALISLLLHMRARQLGDDNPKRLRLADRLSILAVGVGALAVMFNMLELFTMLLTVDPEQFDRALALGMRLVPIPSMWARVAGGGELGRIGDPDRPLCVDGLSPALARLAGQTRTLALELRRRDEEARRWSDEAAELELGKSAGGAR